MILIGRIQSISDIITNSSSEVFLMSEGNANFFEETLNGDECIYTYTLDSLEDIEDNWIAKEYLEYNPEVKPEDLIGYVIVNIEDHYDQWESDCDEASSLSVWQASNR